MMKVLDAKTERSLHRIIIYLAIEEGRNYAESGKPRNHIYRDVMNVARWFDKNPLKN